MKREIRYQKERCNILIKGTLSSGSSVVRDMLREYNNINSIPDEFDYYRIAGLVADQLSLESSIDHPNRIDEIIKIKNLFWRFIYYSVPGNIWSNALNFKIINYLESLFAYPCDPHRKYPGENLRHKFYRIRYLKFMNLKDKLIYFNKLSFLEELNKSLKADIPFEEKIQNSYKWIQNTGRISSFDKDYVLFDQPLDPASDLNIWTKVFKPFKLICVFRDPKDQLAEIINRGILFSPFSVTRMTYTGVNVLSIYGKSRKGMIRFNVDALKRRIEDLEKLESALDPGKLLLIDFEGMINKYDDYKIIIENFLDISDKDHILKKIYFNPDNARNKIGIYKNYLSVDDLKSISELEEWYENRIRNRNHVQLKKSIQVNARD